MSRRIQSIAAGLVVAAIFVLAPHLTQPATAQGGIQVFLPSLFVSSQSSRTGFTLVELDPALTGEWWQWIAQSNNGPLLESGEVDCTGGLFGDALFLAGSMDDLFVGPVARSCTIPGGKTLLAPLFTVSFYNEGLENLTVAEKRAVLDSLYSEEEYGPLFSKTCERNSIIDGIAVENVRVQSPPFPLGSDPEAIQDGYWFAFQLEPGAHEVRFGAMLCSVFDSSPIKRVDVTYTIVVE